MPLRDRRGLLRNRRSALHDRRSALQKLKRVLNNRNKRFVRMSKTVGWTLSAVGGRAFRKAFIRFGNARRDFVMRD
jgi:hypothetical protein